MGFHQASAQQDTMPLGQLVWQCCCKADGKSLVESNFSVTALSAAEVEEAHRVDAEAVASTASTAFAQAERARQSHDSWT